MCNCIHCQKEKELADVEYFKGMQDSKYDVMNAMREARERRELWSTSPEFARILSEKPEEKEKERDISRESWPYKLGYKGIIMIS